MNRRAAILHGLSPRMHGIEVGPWHSPLCPKDEWPNVLVNDVFDTRTLRQRAADDSTISAEAAARIEPVDLVGPAHDLANVYLLRTGRPPGSLDFVVSSHNFEHLPDPVQFLRSVGVLLREGGVLTMAIPDKRRIFDANRPRSTLGQILEAFTYSRSRPSFAQVFDSDVEHLHDGRMARRLRDAWRDWQRRMAGSGLDYLDAHCWTFTPASLAMILLDLRYLGLCPLVLDSISPAGFEMFVRLRKPRADEVGPTADEHYAGRATLFAAMRDEDRA